jgi:biopolymer transport protein ExbB
VKPLILCLLLAANLSAAEAVTGAALASAASTARAAAEQELATLRAETVTARAALATAMHAAHVTANTARDRLRAAATARDAAQLELTQRRKDQERELVLVRQQAEKSVIAARLGDAEAKAIAGLAPAERVAKAAPALRARLDRLPGLLTAQRRDERIVSRDGTIVQAPVLHLGAARAVALGPDHATRGTLFRTAVSSGAADAPWQVRGPAIGNHPGLLAIDVTGSLQQDGVHHGRSLWDWIIAGRFFIWPIIATLLLGVGIAFWRFVRLHRQTVDPRLMAQVASAVGSGDTAGARALVADRRTPLARVLDAGLAVLDRGRDAREAALAQALIAEQPRLQQGLAFLMVLAGIAPLLGLLGTVTGMIDMFGVIADQGSGNAKSLSGAISEALTTTQAGMIVAIPLLLLHAILARIAERRMLRLEEAAIGLIGLGGQSQGNSR